MISHPPVRSIFAETTHTQKNIKQTQNLRICTKLSRKMGMTSVQNARSSLRVKIQQFDKTQCIFMSFFLLLYIPLVLYSINMTLTWFTSFRLFEDLCQSAIKILAYVWVWMEYFFLEKFTLLIVYHVRSFTSCQK